MSTQPNTTEWVEYDETAPNPIAEADLAAIAARVHTVHAYVTTSAPRRFARFTRAFNGGGRIPRQN